MMRHALNHINNRKGFSLVEIMIAVFILVVASAGILVSYFRCMELSEMSRNSSNAVTAVKSRMEFIKNSDFSNLITFHNVTFTSPNVDGIGVSYVDLTNPNLAEIRVVFTWVQSNGRVIGEDLDVDGVLDMGEDANGNGFIDSPVQLLTSVFDV